MRDRLCVLIVALVGVGAPLVGQQADEARSYLPPGPPGTPAKEEIGKLLRLIRKGSGPDRLRFRRDLMLLGADAVPALHEELASGNHLFSWNAALVLGEIRDPRSIPVLGRVVSEEARGDPLAASLALGRFDDPAVVGPLIVQALSGRSRDARRGAALALGRVQLPEATARLIEVAREARQYVDVAAHLVALGMTGDAAAMPMLMTGLRDADDRRRRAAMAGIALQPAANGVESVAIDRLGDEDEEVRLAALAALARCASTETATELTQHAVVTDANDKVRAAATLVIAARGASDVLPFLHKQLADPSDRVRAAAIGGLAANETPFGESLARAGLASTQHALVRQAAVVAFAVLAARRGDRADVAAFIHDRDAMVRDAALVAHVWANGHEARAQLVDAASARREDRLVVRARELLNTLDAGDVLATRMLRAVLQVILDDAGLAPSWNVHRIANEQIILALGLENALPEYGGGGGGGSDDRARAAAARRPPPHREDLRRHLDQFPYSDKRAVLEIPLVRVRPRPR